MCKTHGRSFTIQEAPASGSKVGLLRIINRLWAIPGLVLRVLHVDECPAGLVMVTVRGRRGKRWGALSLLVQNSLPRDRALFKNYMCHFLSRLCRGGFAATVEIKKGILPNFKSKKLVSVKISRECHRSWCLSYCCARPVNRAISLGLQGVVVGHLFRVPPPNRMMNRIREKEIQQNVGQCLTALILVYDTLNFDTL